MLLQDIYKDQIKILVSNNNNNNKIMKITTKKCIFITVLTIRTFVFQKNGNQNSSDNEKRNDDNKIYNCLSDDESKKKSDYHTDKLQSIELSTNSKLNKNTNDHIQKVRCN